MRMREIIQRPEKEEGLEKIPVIEQIKQEILNIKVDLEDPRIAIEKITENIEKQNYEISEGDLVFIKMAVATKANFLRNLERVKGNGTIEMALADAECMENFIKYIRENKEDEEKIKELWQQFDKFYLSFNEQVDEEELTGKYDIRKKPEDVKRGILAEIVAMDLLEETVNNFEGCEKVEIKYSTPEDDVYKKIDFFLVVTFENGKIVEIPIQVTSCNLSTPNNSLDKREKTGLEIKKEREELDKKIKFVLDNIIHTSKTVKNIEIDSDYKYQKRVEEKMKKFFDENKNGVFVFTPSGKVNDKKFDQTRGEDIKKDCVHENGKPSRMLRDYFSKSPVIKDMKDMKASLAQ